MPQLNTYKVSVTVEIEIAGSTYADATRRAEELIGPALKRDAPSVDYPIVRAARIAGIEAEGS